MNPATGSAPGGVVRVLVCGGRDFGDRDAVFRTLNELCGPCSDERPLGTTELIVIHGACPTGADRWADEWVMVEHSRFMEFPADWRTHGRAAGPIRNQRMLDEGKPDLVIAFPGGRGTADMVRRAKKAGVEVREIRCPKARRDP